MPRTIALCAPKLMVCPPTLALALPSAADDLRHGQVVGLEPVVVDHHVIAAQLAAPAGHVHHAGDGAEAALQHPVLQGLEIFDRIALGRGDAIAIDFAHRARRRNRRHRAAGQLRQLRQAIDHLLLRLLVIKIVRELDLHVRQAEQRDRADRRHVRQARHLHFDRDRDVAFHLLGRKARRLRHDLDHRRNRIGIGLDVEVVEGNPARHQHEHEEGQMAGAAPAHSVRA
jgi:hypothetical protein